ncbi:MAG: hypothetical protein KC505_02415 [Myxococcales bacterium]|nr:hypothetical protein [Myxococcales bacterium]USN51757.1 MAG: hypothetical protein H6731_04945 [Myxococcales bacterium]
MKHIFQLSFLGICSLLFIGCKSILFNTQKNQAQSALSHVRTLVDERGLVTQPIVELLKLTQVSCPRDLKSVVSCTQQAWLRRSGLERKDLNESRPELQSKIIREIKNLGLYSEIRPIAQKYDYVFVLGASYQTIKSRLDFLVEEINRGISFEKLVLMGSLRPLDENSEVKPFKFDFKTEATTETEIDLMREIIKFQPYKQSFQQIKIIEIASPMKLDGNKKLVRANTRDTFIDFMKLKLLPGKSLTISNQPYIKRQDLIAQDYLKDGWVNESVGPCVKTDINTNVLLDELSRLLFEIKAFISFRGSFESI